MSQTYAFFLSQLWRVRRNDSQPVILLMDNLRCHVNDSTTIDYLRSSNVECITFPPNTTDALQPLDLHPNSSFKALMKSEMSVLSEISTATQTRVYLVEVLEAAHRAILGSMRPTTLIKGLTLFPMVD